MGYTVREFLRQLTMFWVKKNGIFFIHLLRSSPRYFICGEIPYGLLLHLTRMNNAFNRDNISTKLFYLIESTNRFDSAHTISNREENWCSANQTCNWSISDNSCKLTSAKNSSMNPSRGSTVTATSSGTSSSSLWACEPKNKRTLPLMTYGWRFSL